MRFWIMTFPLSLIANAQAPDCGVVGDAVVRESDYCPARLASGAIRRSSWPSAMSTTCTPPSSMSQPRGVRRRKSQGTDIALAFRQLHSPERSCPSPPPPAAWSPPAPPRRSRGLSLAEGSGTNTAEKTRSAGSMSCTPCLVPPKSQAAIPQPGRWRTPFGHRGRTRRRPQAFDGPRTVDGACRPILRRS